MIGTLMWLNWSIATINVTLQLLDIYRFMCLQNIKICLLFYVLFLKWIEMSFVCVNKIQQFIKQIEMNRVCVNPIQPFIKQTT